MRYAGLLDRMPLSQLEKVLKVKQREKKAAPLVRRRDAILNAGQFLKDAQFGLLEMVQALGRFI